MRKIIFRGKYDGDWVYGNLIRGVDSGQKELCLIENTDPNEFRQWDVDPDTVGQFIRKDQYEKDIYEGDLFMNGAGIRIIEMREGNTHAINLKRSESILLSFIIKSNPKNKVIGNKYDDKKLLELDDHHNKEFPV